MKYVASTQTSVKKDNQKLILDLLVHEGPLSRADIAKYIHSSKPTVSKNVDELLQQHKLKEVGKSDNSVGKKGILIDINVCYTYVLAIDMSKNRFSIVLSDLRHKWICHYEQEDIKLEHPEILVERFIDEHHIDVLTVGKIVIAYPGVVGHNDNLYLTNLKNKEIFLNQLRSYLEKRFNQKALVKNDLNLSVIAEKLLGKYTLQENICLISCDVGVGLGIIINNMLYKGDRNAAGEIGFVLPVQHKDGHFYTLEERIGIYALLKRYEKVTGQKVVFHKLKTLIECNEKHAIALYNSVLEDLCVAITNVASILDIETVIGTGRLFSLKSNMIKELNELTQKMTPFETNIYQSSVDKKALKGAIIVGIEDIINQMVT